MKKINTSPLSGTQELLPEQQAIFNSLKQNIANTYAHHGYLSIETPIIDRSEILFAKAGGDTEKQIYKVIKTTESADGADQALRFDHTVPLARYVVEHENNLTFPFKVTQINRNFRGERAQKGRFREFYQCDVDIIGRGELKIAYDADVIITLLDALKTFNLKTPILARVSNRKILTGLIESMNLTDKSKDIYSIIDHSEKVAPETTEKSFHEIGLTEEEVAKMLKFISIHGTKNTVITALRALNVDNPTFSQGVDELDYVLSLVESTVDPSELSADMTIVRGLDYYTGTVFEFILPEYKQIGSICGGGRYENLTQYFTDQPFPGVGGSIGLTRLFYVLKEYQLIPTTTDNLLDYSIIPITSNEFSAAFDLAKKLQTANHTATVVLTDKKLGDKLSYAAKLAKNGIVIGESEVKTGAYKVKDFTSGEEKELTI